MAELFAAFRQHLVWSLMLFVVIFTGVTAMFANGRLLAFAGGLFRVLASIVATPFLFIRRAVTAVLGHSSEAEARYRASDQYLLNKGMLVLQAIVIVLAVGALSAAIVVTWNVLVPPSEVRRDANEYAKEVEAQRQRSAEADAALAKLDAEWAQKQEKVVAAFRKERQQAINTANKDMTSIESSVQSYAGPNGISTLQNLKQAIAERSHDSYDDIERTKRRLDYIVSNNWYWLGDWGGTLNRWNDLWQGKAIATYQLAAVTIDELRAGEQPSFQETKGMKQRQADSLAEMEQILTVKREDASLKWKAAFFRAIRAFIAFLMFVWLAGAVIEGGWMAIHVADDVRRIREAAPAAAEPVAVPEPRIVIRDAPATRPVAPAEA